MTTPSLYKGLHAGTGFGSAMHALEEPQTPTTLMEEPLPPLSAAVTEEPPPPLSAPSMEEPPSPMAAAAMEPPSPLSAVRKKVVEHGLAVRSPSQKRQCQAFGAPICFACARI
jgi:hypothetical protein